jgi:hypothetical protein
MSQKRNKIIVAITVCLLIALVIIVGISEYKKKSLLKTKELTKEEVLLRDCPSRIGSITLCRYSSETKSAQLITETTQITIDKDKITLPSLNLNDYIAIVFNFNDLITNTPKKELAPKIPDNFKLCFRISPPLVSIKVFPQDKILFSSNDLICTKDLSKTNVPVFAFIGSVSDIVGALKPGSSLIKINNNQIPKTINSVTTTTTREEINPNLVISLITSSQMELQSWVVPTNISLTQEADFYHNYNSSIIRLGNFLIGAINHPVTPTTTTTTTKKK